MPKKRRRARNIIFLASVSFALCLVLFLFDVLAPYEHRSFDIFSRNLNPLRASDRVVIIEIDQQSLDALSAENITWPWPRQIYAPIFEFTAAADAVLVDILFTEASSYGQEDDMILGEAVKKASNVYLPFFLSVNEKPVSAADRAYLKRFSMAGRLSSSEKKYRSVVNPIDTIRQGVKGSGNVAISPDNDGVYRKVPLVFTFDDMTLPSLAFSYLAMKGDVRVESGKILVANRPLPLVEDKLLLRFPRGRNPFTVISAVDVLSAYRGGKGQDGSLTRDFFKGKIVFLGMTAPGLLDVKSTPTMPVSTGVHINAAVVENLQSGTFMRPVAAPFVILTMLLICFGIVVFVLSYHTIIKNLSALAAATAVIVGAAALLFYNQHYLPTAYLLVTLLASFILSVAFSYALEGRERQFIKRTFSQYMDKTIVDYVLQNPDLVKPGGKKAEVTVLFADIAGFTTISEQNTPEDTALMLHRVLNELTEVVIEEKGVVDKYIGDCIMAFWGSPLATPQDEINSCRSALRFIEAIGKINEVFKTEGTPPIAIRVGLHTGDAIVGNMGSVRLFDFTVVGDTVNLASRLESVNKVFGTSIIASEHTLVNAFDLFVCRNLGPIEVKGKSEPVVIYEVLCESSDVSPAVREKVDMYNEAFDLYRGERLSEAVDRFDALLGKYPGDGPSEFYRNRAKTLLENFPLTKRWDIIKMTEK